MSQFIERARAVYESFAKGDVPAVLGALAPDVRWVEAEGGPYGGEYVGPDAVLENVFQRFGTEWDGFAATPSEFLGDGGTVVVLGTYSGTYKATGKHFEAPFAHVWRFDGDRATSFRQITDTVVHLRPMS